MAADVPVAEKKELDPALVRTDDKAKDKYIRDLYNKLSDAGQKRNTEEQNRLFAEMESLNPRHEMVFKAKAEFMEDDDNWDGAHAVYKECVAAIPTSAACDQIARQ